MKRMTTKCWFHAIAAIVLAAAATLARADAPGPLELSIGTGYTRGFGPAAGEMAPNLENLAGNGAALRLEVGWRIDPRWMIGTYYEASRLASGERGTDGMTGAAAGIQGQFHVRPLSSLDPWVGVGFGWRGLWLEHAAGDHVMQGLDLVRLQLGVDYRVSPRFSVAPTVGVALTEFLSEKHPGETAYMDIENRKVGTVLFAGLSGRFDVLGGASERR